jgi:hypothetical protein
MRFIKKLSFWAIIFTTIIALDIVFNLNYWNKENRVIVSDVICYYDYLPAAFIFNDITLSFADDLKNEDYLFWFGTTPEGGRYIKTSMGMAMLYSPFFFLGHLSAHLFDFDTGGFSKPYKMALVFSCIAFLWLGLFFLRKVLIQHFSELISAVVIILISLGTNYLNYSTFDAPMSHTYSFALFAIFIYLTPKWYENPSIKNSILLGLLSGIISLVRPSNAVIGLVFIFYGIGSLKELISRIKLFGVKWFHLLLILLFAFAVWVPQLVYWKTVTGSYFFFSYGEERFFFNNPQIFRGLFSYQNGWLIYAPVMLFALIGIPFMYRFLKPFFIPVFLFTVINIYVILSWWCWWYPGFGNRAMIESYAILALPLASFIKWTSIQKKLVIKISIFLLISMTFLQGVMHSIQYHYSGIHYNSMTKTSYWEMFWKVKTTKKYWDNLREPDYLMAMKGIHAYFDERNDSLMIYCSLEEKHRDGKSITDSTKTYKLTGTETLTDEFSRSGRFGVFVNKDNPHAMGLSFSVYCNEQYRISVWRKKTSVNSHLVAASYVNLSFYHGEKTPISEEGEWEKIQMEIEIPSLIHNTNLQIFVMNDNPEKVYFDDLRVERIFK